MGQALISYNVKLNDTNIYYGNYTTDDTIIINLDTIKDKINAKVKS
jgi:hypothetical protein